MSEIGKNLCNQKLIYSQLIASLFVRLSLLL